MTMLSFRVAAGEAAALDKWAGDLRVDRSELLVRPTPASDRPKFSELGFQSQPVEPVFRLMDKFIRRLGDL